MADENPNIHEFVERRRFVEPMKRCLYRVLEGDSYRKAGTAEGIDHTRTCGWRRGVFPASAEPTFRRGPTAWGTRYRVPGGRTSNAWTGGQVRRQTSAPIPGRSKSGQESVKAASW